MDERHHPRAPDEVRVIDSERETGSLHVAREAIGRVWDQRERDVDVRAQARHSIGDHSLRAEDTPPAPSREDRRQSGQQLNGGGLE